VGAKTKEVGGGANVGTSDMFNNFLQQQMGGGPSAPGAGVPNMQGTAQAPRMNQSQYAGPGGAAKYGQDQQAFKQSQTRMNSGAQQAQNGFGNMGNLVNQMSNGTVDGMMQNNQFLQNAANMPNAPEFTQAQLGQYNTNVPQSDVFGKVFGQQGAPGFLPQSGQQNGINQIDFSQFGAGGQFGGMNNMPSAGATIGDQFGAQGTGGLLNYDLNSPEFAAQRQQLQQDTELARADSRARFGAGGGMSLGSGAALAEAQFNRQVLPANMLAMGQLGRQMQEMDMANRGMNANVLLQQRGQNIDQRGQDLQGSIAGSQMGSQNMGNILQAMLGQQTNQLGAFNSANNFNLGMQGNQLNAAGMDANNALQGFQLGNNAIGAGNADALNAAGMQNNFNQQTFGQQSTNAANQGQLGAQLQGLNAQQQQMVLNQLFGAMGQANQLGTAQRQTVTQPSAGGQLLGAGLQLGGALLGGPMGASIGGALGGMFGGGGGAAQPGISAPQGGGFGFANSIPQVNFGSYNPVQSSFGGQAPPLGGYQR